jgi:hypothetical protein
MLNVHVFGTCHKNPPSKFSRYEHYNYILVI